MEKLDPEDPRIKRSDKTYIGFKVKDMLFDAHLTVMYLGGISVLQEQLAKTAIEEFSRIKSYYVRPKWISMFGPDQDIPVVEVEVPEVIKSLRERLENHGYLPNPSEFPWSPHITLPKDSFPVYLPGVIEVHKLNVY